MKESSISAYDKSGMRRLLTEFPSQIADAVRIGKTANLIPPRRRISNIVVSGLGGSAIGGDLLRSYTAGTLDTPFIVNRHYTLPEFVGPDSLVFISSYSGNTEETIASYEEAIRRKSYTICITSGGEVAAMAKKRKHSVIILPKGYPPRAALGYSFFPMLLCLEKLKFVPNQKKAVEETTALLKKRSTRFRSPAPGNKALEVAKQLFNKLPLIYSGPERFDVVNLRWRGQLSENAKVLAFGNVFPEMNHNELVGWKVLRRLMEETAVIYLRDREDHKRVKLRMEIARGIIGEYASKIIDVESEGRSLLARMFSLIYLGDWVSFYLAVLNGVDPTPVKVIDYLKGNLSKR